MKTLLHGNSYRSGLFAVLLSSLLAVSSAGQQTTPPADTSQVPQSQEQNKSDKSSSQDNSDKSSQNNSDKSGTNSSDIKRQEETGTSNDRLFYALPNFLTVETKNVPPLSPGQKLKVVTRGSFDFIQIPWYGLLAGVSQAENSEPGYGQGAAGYGKRYAAYFADGTIENYFTGAFVPIVLHQDPRYYTMLRGSFTHRTAYAISRIFVTRSDSGRKQFNYSEIVGAFAASAISTYSYHPKGDRNLPNTLSVWGTQVGYDTLTLAIKEFWPDIRRRLSRKK
ncbi:MAG TPA: hypothetical protein VEK33_14010 [Terriglobales bacterium]|nr:hypothetical protein [Terriglobales bacterium]